MNLRVGIDVGGTFTDVNAFDENSGELVAIRKYLSDPGQPAAVMEQITADLAREFGTEAVRLILHGSTAALNTLLEGKGARVGLLTTRGFRDVYEIGRQWRGEEVFNIFAPARIADRLLRLYAAERSEGESATAFFRRVELGSVKALLADLEKVLPGEARPEDFVDLGEEANFTLQTKEGECAA